MIKIPYEEIVYKIEEKTGLSSEEITKKIDDKLAALYGLVSKEGAAHIIANELGVKLFEMSSGKIDIKHVLAGMRNVELHGVVRRVYEVRPFATEKRSGQVGSFLLGDETGALRVVLWNKQADQLSTLKENTTVVVKGGVVKERNGFKELHLNDSSILEITGTAAPTNTAQSKSEEFARKTIISLTEADSAVELLGTIVQVFDLRFFEVCPTCRKRAKPSETGEHFCAQHGTVTPMYTAVMNLFLDDGTDTIRIVCFGRQIARLLGKSEADLLPLRVDPLSFDALRNELLGTMLKVDGKVVKNAMFDRLELIASLVFLNPNPEQEIEKLKDDIRKQKELAPTISSDSTEQPESSEEDVIRDDNIVDE